MAHVAQSVERVLGKDEVTSSILVVGSIGSESGGDRRVFAFGGSNSEARVTAFQAVGRGFDSRLPLHLNDLWSSAASQPTDRARG